MTFKFVTATLNLVGEIIMYEATFELKTLTPLFMRGADQSKAEFRPASVKGAMRWWFRALAGNYFGNDIENLRKAECRVFGCAGTGRSRVIVEVVKKSEAERLVERINIDLRYNKRAKKYEFSYSYSYSPKVEFKNYLWFSIKMAIDESLKGIFNDILRKNRIWNKFPSEDKAYSVLKIKGLKIEDLEKSLMKEFNKNAPYYYPPGSEFEVKLKSYSINDLKLAILSFWLAVTFGGFGFRARRGAGSMRIVSMRGNSPEVNDFLNLLNVETVIKAVKYPKPENEEDKKQDSPEAELRRFLREAFERDPIEEGVETPYPVLKNIVVLVKETSFLEEALKSLEKDYAGEFKRITKYTIKGEKKVRRYDGGVRFEFADRDSYDYSDFSHAVVGAFASKNNKNKSGHDENRSQIKNKDLMNERRFFFGLPLIYANWRVQMIAHRQVNSKGMEYKRRASPVWLSVKEINGKYYAMVVLLPSKFLLDNYKLLLTKGKNELELEPPNESLPDFLTKVEYWESENNKKRGGFRARGFERIETVLGIAGGV